MNEMMQMVSTIGFPIVMVFVMVIIGKYLIESVFNKMIDRIDEIQKRQDESLDCVRDALNNNTSVINHLQGIIETFVVKK